MPPWSSFPWSRALFFSLTCPFQIKSWDFKLESVPSWRKIIHKYIRLRICVITNKVKELGKYSSNKIFKIITFKGLIKACFLKLIYQQQLFTGLKVSYIRFYMQFMEFCLFVCFWWEHWPFIHSTDACWVLVSEQTAESVSQVLDPKYS